MFTKLQYPIIQAPMAGGVSTAELAIAVSQSGGLGFLAAGYKSPEALEQEISTLAATGLPYGVNLFVPQADFIGAPLFAYKKQLEQDFQMQLVIQEPTDDYWYEKLTLVRQYEVPYVSFTFGCPSKEMIASLKSRVIVTVTNEAEALIAEQNGADAICLQGLEAGGHRATFQNEQEDVYSALVHLIHTIRQQIALPIIAAGGIMNGQDIHLMLSAGAQAVQLGTAFLCTGESGANTVYKQALQSGEFTETELTRAFTGRPARGLKNDFIVRYSSVAPASYPAIHTVTQPIRVQALKESNAQAMSLWAGERFWEIRSGSATELMKHLVQEWQQLKGHSC